MQKRLIPKYTVLRHTLYQLLQRRRRQSAVGRRNPQEYAYQHYLTVAEVALDYVAMQVKNASVKLVRRKTLVCCPHSCFDLTHILVQTLLYHPFWG